MNIEELSNLIQTEETAVKELEQTALNHEQQARTCRAKRDEKKKALVELRQLQHNLVTVAASDDARKQAEVARQQAEAANAQTQQAAAQIQQELAEIRKLREELQAQKAEQQTEKVE